MTETRSERFDDVVRRIQAERDAGRVPSPELLWSAVGERMMQVEDLLKRSTPPRLGWLECLLGGAQNSVGMHSLGSDQPINRAYLRSRGLYGLVESMPLRSPGQEYDVSFVAGVEEIEGYHDLRYALYRVDLAIEADPYYERALAIHPVMYSGNPLAIGQCFPGVTPMLFLRLMSQGFGQIQQRHLERAMKASQIGSAMEHQNANLARALGGMVAG